MQKDMLDIKTVHQCNCCMGTCTLHPLVSVIDLSKINIEHSAVKFDFYTILLLKGRCGEYVYGGKYYDYSEASMLFLAPGESFRFEKKDILSLNGWLLAFHPELLSYTSLGENMDKYTFFRYHLNEALHVSLKEKTKVVDGIMHIKEELQHAIDCHTKILVSKHIELLLDYCLRFYERQFITRQEVNKLIMKKVNLILDDYIQNDQLKWNCLPTAEYCAELLHLSPQYFVDLLKFETGSTLSEYFQLKRLQASKSLLMDKNNSVAMVASKLGYSNVQCFCSLFKKMTGIAPNEYRFVQN